MSTTTVTRQIVHIDEALCNGCGVCVSPCAEGAIVLVDGKAKVVKEELCDGAGFCLGVCPTGALTLEVRETVPYRPRRRRRARRRDGRRCGGRRRPRLHRAALLQLRPLRR